LPSLILVSHSLLSTTISFLYLIPLLSFFSRAVQSPRQSIMDAPSPAMEDSAPPPPTPSATAPPSSNQQSSTPKFSNGLSASSPIRPSFLLSLTLRVSRHIRSRITVVCAEVRPRGLYLYPHFRILIIAQCKRLKLRCDRRSPCGSCVKRDTVQRCQYTAAAAEKMLVLHYCNLVTCSDS